MCLSTVRILLLMYSEVRFIFIFKTTSSLSKKGLIAYPRSVYGTNVILKFSLRLLCLLKITGNHTPTVRVIIKLVILIFTSI